MGVPQGSILGPTPFLMYVNDLTRSKLKGNIIQYADDTILFYSENNLQICHCSTFECQTWTT